MKKLILLGALLSFNVFAKPVNINTADAKTIAASLSGIGEKKANEIVQYRTKVQKFSTLADLEKVPGIGKKTIEKNAQDILFSDSGNTVAQTPAKTKPAQTKK
jgi:competence protein ComEA